MPKRSEIYNQSPENINNAKIKQMINGNAANLI
jgi:hypothetical protein